MVLKRKKERKTRRSRICKGNVQIFAIDQNNIIKNICLTSSYNLWYERNPTRNKMMVKLFNFPYGLI